MSSSLYLKFALAAFVLSLQYGVPGKAFASLYVSEPIGDDYFERNTKSVPIAGAFVTSVIVVEELPSEKKPEVKAYIPHAWAEKMVCVRGYSVDGRYESKRNHQLPAATAWKQSEPIEFSYPTKSLESQLLVENARLEHFGMTISLGECDDDGEEFVPVYLNAESNASPNDIVISINSVGADSVQAFIGESADAPWIDCDRILANSTKGFDFSCLIDTGEIHLDTQSAVEINAKSDGYLDDPIQIKIHSPQ